MRPLHRLAIMSAALALAPSILSEDERVAQKLAEQKPEPLMTPDGYRKQHQGLRERTRRMKQQAKIAAKAQPPGASEPKESEE